ncbi:MAG TPA: UDP-N-acetylmuramate dehydrogenase [Acidimicrobiia bacterium]|nr:UDP-N-acetylmuramate dehydrogenase [Acidimicrobiia bacterium]
MTLDATIAALEGALPGAVERAAPSAALTTYRCGGPLAARVLVENEDQLLRVAEIVRTDRVPVLVIGRGSNLLVADAGFAGVALSLAGDFEQFDVDTRAAHVNAGGAVALPVLARRAAAAGVGGVEFFVGIPGSVGGAVRMNAGGHGRETRDVFVSARVCDLDQGQTRELTLDDLRFGYRRSALTSRHVVVSATFEGAQADPAVCTARIDEIVRWRREHQPGGQNAGSVFTNPPNDAAGRIIDACGLKGLSVGGASVSAKHANFFVAEPGATADDVHALVCTVQRQVELMTGVRLHPELQFVGFDSEGSA